ncbi:MAG: hypothetical protein GF334_06085 [Candidatus Altiarchaeales archaeon]|nr:hypothetical protein [Candidatus Altiarchaeales archaeon]
MLISIAAIFFLLINLFVEVPPIKPVYFFTVLPFILLTITANSLRTIILLKVFNIRMGLREALDVSIVTTTCNYLMPFRGGAGFRAVYLKKKYYFPYTDFTATLIATYLISFTLYSLLGVGSVIFLGLGEGVLNLKLLLFFSALTILVFFCILLGCFLKSKVRGCENKYVKYIHMALTGLNKIILKKDIFTAIIAVEMLNLFSMIFRFYLAFKALGYDISATSSIIFAVVSMTSMLINITPAGLGVREATVSFTSKLTGLGLKAGALAGILDRFVAVSVVGILFLLTGYSRYAQAYKKRK